MQFNAGVGSGRTLQAPAPQGSAPSLSLTLISGLRLGPPFPLPIGFLAVRPMGILLLLLLLLLGSGVTLIPLLTLTVLGGSHLIFLPAKQPSTIVIGSWLQFVSAGTGNGTPTLLLQVLKSTADKSTNGVQIFHLVVRFFQCCY